MLSRLVASAAQRATASAFTIRNLHATSILSAIEVKMPSLSPTMTEGTIVKWMKSEGESVSAGDVVCEIQTDKAVVALEVDEDGTLAKIIKPADSGTIKVGTLIAVLAEEGEDLNDTTIVSSSEDSNEVVSEGSTLGIVVNMPSLSPTMTEGTLVKWCKKEGESISAGDVLCEIQTDKAVVSMEWDDDAILAKILVSEGASGINVNSMIALMVNEGEDWQNVQIPGQDKPEKSAKSKSAKPTGGSTPGTEVKMPSLSPTMTEGTIVKWCFSEGDKLEAGDVLCEIQTDKAVVAMEIDDEAILAKILVPEGESGIQINSLIALTVNLDQDWKDVTIPAQTSSEDLTEISVEIDSAPETETQEVTESHVVPVANAGPAVMLLCAQYGIDPTKVSSTGPKGLLKTDIMKYIKENNLTAIKVTTVKADKVKVPTAKAGKVPKVEKKSQPSTAVGTGAYTDIPLTSMRAVIAKRLSQSKSTSPHGYSTAECNIDAINAIRQDFKENGVKVSLNDLIIKAAATTLQLVPEVNINVVGEAEYRILPNVDISVAVATPNGLITPIVTNAIGKTLPEISSSVRDLALRARDGKLQLNEFQGGTFTISNLGMFGIKEFTAIINPPQCAIMAVGSGSIEIDPETGKPFTAMRATLSFDRRFIDEFTANEFMSTFQRVVEQPQYMNLGLVAQMRRAMI